MLETNIAAGEVDEEGLRIWSTAVDRLGGADYRWRLFYTFIAKMPAAISIRFACWTLSPTH